MNNLPYNLQNFYANSRSGEPIFVNDIESARSFPTIPNSTTVLFDKTTNLFYRIETDFNNKPVIERYRYTKEVDSEEAKQYVTLEEFNKFKEELLNGRQYIQVGATEPTAANIGCGDSESPAANELIKPGPGQFTSITKSN